MTSTFETQSLEYSRDDIQCKNGKDFHVMPGMGECRSGKGSRAKGNGKLPPVDLPTVNLGKGGLKLSKLKTKNYKWDFNSEAIHVKEDLAWLDNMNDNFPYSYDTLRSWLVRGPKTSSVDGESKFCDRTLLGKILKAKGIFDELDPNELCKARSRANPFETVRSAFFMNRAALKMANIDAATNFIFTEVDRNPHHTKQKGPFYFADVCAGPGGFSEYVLWRKKWLFKGFGFTLREVHDFELAESQCASPVTFHALYGEKDDGDICRPENIKHFTERVLHETEGLGVHFVMSDGGFSVEGNENLQEILSKQLYMCQCVMGLEIVRAHGHFVTKLFDLFTGFSVGLIFLMYNCFEKITILKPNTSRPANSERYLICQGLKSSPATSKIKKYLFSICEEMSELRASGSGVDINEIVPLSIIKGDRDFYNFILASNNRIGANQVAGLLKLSAFCRNPKLVEGRQEELRVECLNYWRIPDKPKIPLPRFTTDDLLRLSVRNPDFMIIPPRQVCDTKQLKKLLADGKNWSYVLSGCTRRANICNFYAGVGGSRVYRLQRCRWVKVKKLQLICGTLLYGEMVKETIEYTTSDKPIQKQSLHVMDALRLGDTSLADLPFKERLDLIETYCQAINHEFREDHTRVRIKPTRSLEEIGAVESLAMADTNNEGSFTILPSIGFNSIREYFGVNSILLMKNNLDQSFPTTFKTRIQIFLNENQEDEAIVSSKLGLIVEFIQSAF